MSQSNTSSSPASVSAEPTSSADLSDSPELLRENPWLWWRNQMPIAERFAYFDHAAVAPLSQPTVNTIQGFAEQAGQLGDTVWPQWASAVGELRHRAARWLNCDVSEICLIPNTTTGISLVAEGWPFESGESVVLPEGEFPSNLFPWLHQESRGVDVRVVPRREGAVLVDDLLDHCDHTTRIIATSWVGYASGFRVDIDDLVRRAHQRGIAVFVDAIQGLGIYPLDLKKTPVDFLSADGHKWLLGPEGVGVAMVQRQHHNRIRPSNVGWASVKNPTNYAQTSLELRDDAARFESGAANMVGAMALNASWEMFEKVRDVHGDDAIGDRVCSLARRLDERLRSLGATTDLPADPRHQSGIVNFQLPGVQPVKFRSAGLKKDVVVSCRGAGIRAAIHAYNNDDDLDRLVQIAEEFVNAGT